MRHAVRLRRVSSQPGNGLAYGAAARILHRAADRPFRGRPANPTACGGRLKDASRSFDRPWRAVLDPTTAPVGRCHRPPPAAENQGRPAATTMDADSPGITPPSAEATDLVACTSLAATAAWTPLAGRLNSRRAPGLPG